jgi:hypothetical protein
MYQVASEAALVSVSSDADMAVEDDSLEMGGEEYIPKPPYVAKKPYYSVAKGSSSFSNENKNTVYQPKAKRYHQYAVKNLELEYEDDFEKNLKKIIDSTLVEQTAVLKEHSDEMVLETVASETEPEAVVEEEVAVEISSYPNELLEPTGIHEKVEEISPVQIQESKKGGHGSADCAMIPKQELDRGTGYFRFFSS